jgi:transcriptional regulator of arginine metabolism
MATNVAAPAALPKRERHRLIRRVIADAPIATQHELVRALRGLGCDVTQATVSRDVRELDLRKARDAVGRARYVLPSPDRPHDPERAAAGILAQFVRALVPAGQMLVLRVEIGTAPTVGRAIDNVNDHRIAGTVAGDDTLLVVCRTTRDAKEVCSYLERLSG